MIGHFINKTGFEVKTTMTWPDLQALIEHWRYEPPVPWLLARYFEYDERPVEAHEMEQEEAADLFSFMFGEMGKHGRMSEH